MELDLLVNYPSADRRGVIRTEEDRKVARRFGREFFDGVREQGYGGYHYHPKYWSQVVPLFREYYELSEGSSVLDVGCAKGFMLYEFQQLGLEVSGLDISDYAISKAIEPVKPYVRVGDAKSLPYGDKSFDLVVSINTLHNLARNDLIASLKEISRVGWYSFITVDAYRDEAEKKRMEAWNLTAKTVLHVAEWEELFNEAGYEGDYYWTFV
jgi:SAM-dependent methyltransferase